jgi:hypothetical protein
MAGILKCDQVQSDSNLAFAIAGSNVAFMNATSLQMVGSNVSLAGTNVITNGKVVTSAQPVGAVLQVVQGTFSTQTSLTGTTPTATGITATITPTSATSKIFITVYIPAYNSSNAANAGYYLYKNGSSHLQLAYYQGSASQVALPHTAVILDSPATTSATTYAIFAVTAAAATMTWAFGNLQCNITLMEIAA